MFSLFRSRAAAKAARRTSSGVPQNVIADNAANGVYVASGTGSAIHQNSIYGNAGMGIDLAPSANANQAAPVISSVRSFFFGVQVSGSLRSTPNSTFTIELFGNPTLASSGKVYLGTVTVKTNAAGVANFTITVPRIPPNLRGFTTTATSASNNTSEFSKSVLH